MRPLAFLLLVTLANTASAQQFMNPNFRAYQPDGWGQPYKHTPSFSQNYYRLPDGSEQIIRRDDLPRGRMETTPSGMPVWVQPKLPTSVGSQGRYSPSRHSKPTHVGSLDANQIRNRMEHQRIVDQVDRIRRPAYTSNH